VDNVYVAYWHLADIPERPSNVRRRGDSEPAELAIFGVCVPKLFSLIVIFSESRFALFRITL
jgi:hypothetical protein